MSREREVLSAQQLRDTLVRMADAIAERHEGTLGDLALVGIRTRGIPLADRLAKLLEERHGATVPRGVIDITLYRDDLVPIGPQPVVHGTDVPVDVERSVLLLVDDVLYTGRTVRAALEALIALGRPRRIELAVLVDRGHRELPIAADLVGSFVDTESDEVVDVQLKETDGKDRVVVRSLEDGGAS